MGFGCVSASPTQYFSAFYYASRPIANTEYPRDTFSGRKTRKQSIYEWMSVYCLMVCFRLHRKQTCNLRARKEQ